MKGERVIGVGEHAGRPRFDRFAGGGVIAASEQPDWRWRWRDIGLPRDFARLGVGQLVPGLSSLVDGRSQRGAAIRVPLFVRSVVLSDGGHAFDRDIVDHKAAATAVLEAETAIGQVGGGQRHRLAFWKAVDKVFQPIAASAGIGNTDTEVAARLITDSANLADGAGVATRIVDDDRGRGGWVAIDE